MMQPRPRTASFEQASATALYQTYAPMIFGYLRRQTPSREDAEDLLLDVFLAAFERGGLAAFPEEEQVAWLRQVARYKLIDYYRRRARRSTTSIDAYAEEMYEDEALAPEQVALHHEEERRLRAAVQQLSPEQQQVLRLRFGEGWRTAHIAEVMGKQEGAVRMVLSRALKLLRGLYRDDQEGVTPQ
jgi:RNA polymerase sigma factor (sigma-70 family)